MQLFTVQMLRKELTSSVAVFVFFTLLGVHSETAHKVKQAADVLLVRLQFVVLLVLALVKLFLSLFQIIFLLFQIILQVVVVLLHLRF